MVLHPGTQRVRRGWWRAPAEPAALPPLRLAVRELGEQRVLFGSDAGGRSFASQIAKVEGADLPDATKRLVFKENLKRLLTPILAAKGVKPNELIVCVLDRPRHAELIAELRELGCGIQLIPDGDVAGVIAVTDPDTTVDMYMGSGGAPEGVLAAAALRCVGGQFNGKLLFRNEDERARARKWGIEDFDRIYKLGDLAKGDCIFAATGVTDGSLLSGVKRLKGGKMTTESVVMRASSGTVRWVRGEHHSE